VDDAEIKDARKFSAHVIVFGSIRYDFLMFFSPFPKLFFSGRDFFFFVCTLRASHLRYSEIFPIVFVSQERPTQEDWRIFSKFPLIYFLVVCLFFIIILSLHSKLN